MFAVTWDPRRGWGTAARFRHAEFEWPIESEIGGSVNGLYVDFAGVGTGCEASDRPWRADQDPFRRGPPLAPVGPRFLGATPAAAGRKNLGTVLFGSSHRSRFRRCFAAYVERIGYESANEGQAGDARQDAELRHRAARWLGRNADRRQHNKHADDGEQQDARAIRSPDHDYPPLKPVAWL